jgi:elongation factor 3
MDKKRQREALGYEDEEGEELCNCEFSLAYGGMILLSNTRLRLLRGQRYGLCGPNGSGKTTLMRAINKGQVEGFPSPDVLRTVFVEHDLQGSDGTESVLDFVASDSKLSDKKREEIASALASVGFTAERQANTVSSLSGGWKMKLELARAMLYNADILLLDEPTNHLDVTNVQWLVDYLNGLKNVTSIIVSHDSGFLDKVCTNIVHYESRKLKQYKGNLSEFVKVRPEAKSYYELSNTQLTFRFPEPGFLDGVKTKEKAILRMTNCTFTYPGASQPSVKNVSIHASLSSRVGVVGPNGAGKSTIIKLFTGELVPQVGEIIRHPALRLAYVAQHAFHHIESKLDMTANQYIQWRYRYGEDREVALKESRQLTEEDEALLKKPILVEGEKRYFESLEGRRKDKRSYEYEVKWLNRPTEENTWMSRDKLESLGYSKILQQCDDREVARAGMYQRPLTAVNVQKHLADVGLEPEFSTHNRMRGLSGGQKVKVVIGAAMWQNPHILIMDEPTNYLDRDSLGALASAIKEFAGGVVIISHNAEFVRETCKEIWNVDHGVLSREGEAPVADKTVIEVKEQETVTDALGNVSKVKSTRTLSRKELKAKEKRRAQRRKAGLPSDSEEDAEDF